MTLYALYGLAVASDFDCPELSEITPKQAAARNYDTIYVKRAQARLELAEARQYESWMWATRDAALYEVPDIARFLVERPDRITVEMLPEAAESDMRAYLLGMGIATLLHMRGLIPLHIAAIQMPDGVVAFTGQSGAGKSTMVAALHFKHGWPVICDDVAVLHPSDERPLLHAGMNRIKLWRDAVERLNVDPSRLTRDVMRMDKFHLHAPEMFVKEPVELERLVEIGGEESAKVSGAAAFEICMNAIYRPELAGLFGDKAAIFSTISRLAPHISITKEPRPTQ